MTLDEFCPSARDEPWSFGRTPSSTPSWPTCPSRRSSPSSGPTRRWHVAVLSGRGPKGRWRLGRKTNTVAFMGGCDMDLRRAEIEGPEVEITALAFMGGIDIIVPEGFDVDLRGFSFMGGRNLKLPRRAHRPGLAPHRGPRLRLHGWHRRQEPPRTGCGPGDRPGRLRERPRCRGRLHRPRRAGRARGRGGVGIGRRPRRHRHRPLLRHGRLRRHDRAAGRPGTAPDPARASPHRARGGGSSRRTARSTSRATVSWWPSAVWPTPCAAPPTSSGRWRPMPPPTAGSRSPSTSASTPVDAVAEGDDFLGHTVIVASRLADAAAPGEILVSSLVGTARPGLGGVHLREAP